LAGTNVLVIDTTNDTISYIAISPSSPSLGCVLAPNGYIYFVPCSSSTITLVRIDPSTNTVYRFGSLSGNYYGGILGPDGNVYCPPNGSTSILVINTTTNTTSTFGSLPASTTWSGGKLASNGNIYCIAGNGTSFFRINFSGLTQLPSINYCLSPWSNKY
jgi:DNA-binding beta-propeller fold protein YncE